MKRIILITALLQFWLSPAFCDDPPPLHQDSFESAFISSFRATPDSLIDSGSTTISWSTAYAISCTPSGGTGGWDSTIIDLPGGSAQIDIATVGTYIFTLACVGADSIIAVANEVVIVSSPVTMSSFSAAPDSLLEGGSTTLSWATTDAASCTPSGGTGGWDALSIDLPSGSAPIDIATAGAYTFTLTCEGAGNSSVVEEQLVTVSRPVTISSFSASPDSIIAGGNTTISWDTADATSCTPSGGTGGWDSLVIDLPTGSAQIDIASVGTYTFTLTCNGAEGSTAVETEVVTVNPSVGSCDPSPLIGVIDPWANFWDEEFPLPHGTLKNAVIGKTGYLALEFNTGNVVGWGLLQTVNTTLTKGLRTGAVSECPGDFDVVSGCAGAWGTGGGIAWRTDGGAGGCPLKANTTYYFNVTFTDGFDPGTSTCVSQIATRQCIAALRHDYSDR